MNPTFYCDIRCSRRVPMV